MADFDVAYGQRWESVREKVLAMREIWTSSEAEYHGVHVNFDPMWCWPKPLQAEGPPIIMGAGGNAAPRRIVEYCKGWMPIDGAHNVEKLMVDIRQEMGKADRLMDELDLTIISGHADTVDERRIETLFKLGFHRISFFVAPGPPSEQRPVLENRAEVVRRFNGG